MKGVNQAGVRISVYVSQDALVILRRVAKKRKLSRSKAVVAIIHEYEAAQGKKP